MVLRVQYGNNNYDYVSSLMIEDLIRQRGITTFFRPSEKRWVDVEDDPLRGQSDVFYIGPERRSSPTGS